MFHGMPAVGSEGARMEHPARPRLILIEGVPGSGKSTTAQFLLRRYAQQGIASRWWYEEEAGHPLYLFDDAASLQRVLADLTAGNQQRIIDAVLEKWRALSREIQASETIVILDSCLFGYLTWTLFPFDVPEEVIAAYLAQAEQIIHAISPRLIYLYQDDVAAALRTICRRRGGETEQRFIRNATESAYGKRHGLRGFAGMVAFWGGYREFTDAAFARIQFPKLAIETAAGDWLACQRAALQFLDLPTTDALEAGMQDPERFVGDYRGRGGDAAVVCRVRMANHALHINDLPFVWPENRLIPIAVNRFAIESFPFTVQFEEDGTGAIAGMVITGAALLSGPIDHRFVRHRDETHQGLPW